MDNKHRNPSIYTPSIHLSKIYLYLSQNQRKKIKSLLSLISRKLCEIYASHGCHSVNLVYPNEKHK